MNRPALSPVWPSCSPALDPVCRGLVWQVAFFICRPAITFLDQAAKSADAKAAAAAAAEAAKGSGVSARAAALPHAIGSVLPVSCCES